MVIFNLLPELILFIGALMILMVDVFFAKKTEAWHKIALASAVALALLSLYSVTLSYGVNNVLLFSNSFLINKFTSFAKIVILILVICVFCVSQNFNSLEKRVSGEFVALILIATCGAMLLISANDLLSFYLSFELQSLPLYILAAMKRNSNKSSESGMKYFLLGSTSSGILLLGISFVYGFTGTTNFNDLLYLMDHYNSNFFMADAAINFPIGLLFGLILVLIGILFKISAAPFHMWTPDVYEGAPTNITAFFASVIKFTMILVTLKIYIYILYSWNNFNQILILIAVLSLLVGCLGALKQQNLKRMFAFSSIGHVGFMVAGLAGSNFESFKAVILYATIYSSLSIGAFALLLILANKNADSDEDKNNDKIYRLSSLAGISKTNPLIALCLTILMFSMAGIPPLAGFFSKFYILLGIIEQKLYYLAVLAVMTSIISAAYYLRIVKIMYFDHKNPDVELQPQALTVSVLVFSTLFNLLFLALAKPLLAIISNFFN